jgi:hypothetical protein
MGKHLHSSHSDQPFTCKAFEDKIANDESKNLPIVLNSYSVGPTTGSGSSGSKVLTFKSVSNNNSPQLKVNQQQPQTILIQPNSSQQAADTASGNYITPQQMVTVQPTTNYGQHQVITIQPEETSWNSSNQQVVCIQPSRANQQVVCIQPSTGSKVVAAKQLDFGGQPQVVCIQPDNDSYSNASQQIVCIQPNGNNQLTSNSQTTAGYYLQSNEVYQQTLRVQQKTVSIQPTLGSQPQALYMQPMSSKTVYIQSNQTQQQQSSSLGQLTTVCMQPNQLVPQTVCIQLNSSQPQQQAVYIQSPPSQSSVPLAGGPRAIMASVRPVANQQQAVIIRPTQVVGPQRQLTASIGSIQPRPSSRSSRGSQAEVNAKEQLERAMKPSKLHIQPYRELVEKARQQVARVRKERQMRRAMTRNALQQVVKQRRRLVPKQPLMIAELKHAPTERRKRRIGVTHIDLTDDGDDDTGCDVDG